MKTQELEHRLKMIQDDVIMLRRFIASSRTLTDLFKGSTEACDEANHHLSNIEISCDLNSQESLQWEEFKIK